MAGHHTATADPPQGQCTESGLGTVCQFEPTAAQGSTTGLRTTHPADMSDNSRTPSQQGQTTDPNGAQEGVMDELRLRVLYELPPTVDIRTAARLIGLGRTKAYQLARNGEFPCRILRYGTHYRVPTAELLNLLGLPAKLTTPNPAA